MLTGVSPLDMQGNDLLHIYRCFLLVLFLMLHDGARRTRGLRHRSFRATENLAFEQTGPLESIRGIECSSADGVVSWIRCMAFAWDSQS